MGHAFNTALIDTIVRYQRLAGKNVLCLPGTDHASIAVQTILEKQLKEEGKTRHDLGREAFLERAWQWKAESGGRVTLKHSKTIANGSINAGTQEGYLRRLARS